MQPINKNERKKAFTNFLVLFLVSIIIITTTVFSSIQVPFKENDQLLREKGIMERERAFEDKFINGVAGITSMLDTINTKAAKPDFLDAEISKNITELNSSVDAEAARNKIFYKTTLLSLDELRRSKKQLRDLVNKDLNVGEMQKQNQELSDRLEQAKNTIEEQRKTIHDMQQRQ